MRGVSSVLSVEASWYSLPPASFESNFVGKETTGGGPMSHPSQPKKPGGRLPLMADDLLVKQALAGDQGAFEALVNKYERPLRGYLWSILKEEELIADVLQQVFLQLSVWLPKLSTNQSLKAWLFRVAYHQCLDELRKKTASAGHLLFAVGRAGQRG